MLKAVEKPPFIESGTITMRDMTPSQIRASLNTAPRAEPLSPLVYVKAASMMKATTRATSETLVALDMPAIITSRTALIPSIWSAM